MVLAIVLLMGYVCVSDAIQSFNTPDFACARGVPFVTSCTRTSELRRPQFSLVCRPNQSRDHTIELQIAKAFLNEDNKTSLSCKTIRWLNYKQNVQCIPKMLNAEKGKFFKELMERVRVNACTEDEKRKLRSKVRCFLKPGAVQCGSPISCSSRGFFVSESCCCQPEFMQDYSSSMLPSMSSMFATKELQEDLSELDRFLNFKIELFCAGTANTTFVTTKQPRVAKH